jgi:hypothetical protein
MRSSLCFCVRMCIHPIVVKQRLGKHFPSATNTRAKIIGLLGTSFSLLPVSYQTKVGHWFLPQLPDFFCKAFSMLCVFRRLLSPIIQLGPFVFAESLQGPHEKRLLHTLLDHYNVLERPVANESDPLQLSFGLTLMQIIDVVSTICVPLQ